ncbi:MULTISPECIES: hypothetical protein [Brucella]|jgi:hypothetical protein|uniref:hypothetical protein n=1 Tax=Brucella TaxID=234 RepID=UPI0028992212|nr:hypothetical protein [Brucella sp.]
MPVVEFKNSSRNEFADITELAFEYEEKLPQRILVPIWLTMVTGCLTFWIAALSFMISGV